MYNCLFRCVAALALLAPLAFASAAIANPRDGSQSGIARAPANGETLHCIVYNGGQQADFSIVGDGDTTLNIVVEDAAGNVIVRTRGPGDRCHVSWRPARTATYYIYVVNPGSVYNEYRWHAY